MQIKYYCPLWGMRGMPLSQALNLIKKASYDGVEIAVNPDRDDLDSLKKTFQDFELEMIAQFPYAQGSCFEEELEDYASKLNEIVKLQPQMVNCHTGRDYFTPEQNLAFIRKAELIEKQSGITISHEIHRGRFSYSAAQIGYYLDRVPALRLSADFSHWCVVSESLLENFEDVISRVIPCCVLIHSRVGNEQSPQVNHPFAPENKVALEAHVDWWQKIIDDKKSNNIDYLNITCEFGPIPYMPAVPFTNQPLASQWEINLQMKNYLQNELKL